MFGDRKVLASEPVRDIRILNNYIMYFFPVTELLAFGEFLSSNGDLVSWGITDGKF